MPNKKAWFMTDQISELPSHYVPPNSEKGKIQFWMLALLHPAWFNSQKQISSPTYFVFSEYYLKKSDKKTDIMDT